MEVETIDSPLEESLPQEEPDESNIERPPSLACIEEPAAPSPQEIDSLSSEEIILVSDSPSLKESEMDLNPGSVSPHLDLPPESPPQEVKPSPLKETPSHPVEATSSDLPSFGDLTSDPVEFPAEKLVWAKLSGFRFWPGLVVDSANDINLPSKLKTPYREGWILVHFFGTYDYAWVPPKSCVVSWETGTKRNYAGKCKSKFFLLALTEAGEFIEKGTTPKGFEVIPDVLESDSGSGSESNTEAKNATSTSLGKVTTRAASKRSNNVTCAGNAVVSIKKLKLSNTNVPSSQDSMVEAPKPMREGKKRCVLIMKKLGLAPPDPFLGRKFPERKETDPDSKSTNE